MAPGSPLAPTPSSKPSTTSPLGGISSSNSTPVSPPSPPVICSENLEQILSPAIYKLLGGTKVAGAALVVVKAPIKDDRATIRSKSEGAFTFCRVFGYGNVAKREVMDAATSLLDAGSCARLLAVLAAMIYWQKGTLDFGANVNHCLPAKLAVPANGFAAPVTVCQLLTHTSGLGQEDENKEPGSPGKAAHSPRVQTPCEKGSLYSDQVSANTRLLKENPPQRVAPPGCLYADAEANTLLLGAVLEKSSGQPYPACVTTQVLHPLGMAATAKAAAGVVSKPPATSRYAVVGGVQSQLAAMGEELTAVGGMLTTAEDMGRLLLACLEGIPSGGGVSEQPISPRGGLLTEAAVRSMQSAHFGTSEEEVAYGFVRRPLHGSAGPPILVAPAGGGGLDGSDSLCCLLPGANVGLWVATNTTTDKETAFTEQVLDLFLDKFFPPALPASQGPSTWFQALPPVRSDPIMTLFCFPYLAASAPAHYQPWSAALPSFLQVCGVTLPGRGSRSGESPQTKVRHLAAQIGQALLETLRDERPYALFGHGFGALLAYEVARFVSKQGGRAPSHLFVSGRGFPLAGRGSVSGLAPTQLKENAKDLHTLPDATFVATLSTSDLLPRQYKEKHLMLRAMLPMLRADITAEETYEHSSTPRGSRHTSRHLSTAASPRGSPKGSPRQASTEPELTCPVAVLAGTLDESVDTAGLESWSQLTSGATAVHRIVGSHYYLDESVGRKAAMRVITKALAGSLTAYGRWLKQVI